jgi:arginine decarboxylase-like protein
MKINLFKKEHNFKKKDFQFNTNLYWKLFLLGAFIIILYAFFFGYQLFTETNQEITLSTNGSTEQIETVNKDRVLKVLNYFSEREKKSAEILNSPAPVVDPSL